MFLDDIGDLGQEVRGQSLDCSHCSHTWHGLPCMPYPTSPGDTCPCPTSLPTAHTQKDIP